MRNATLSLDETTAAAVARREDMLADYMAGAATVTIAYVKRGEDVPTLYAGVVVGFAGPEGTDKRSAILDIPGKGRPTTLNLCRMVAVD